MLKRNILLIATILFLPLLSFSQQRWEITLGRPNISESAIDKMETYDNGYCLLNYERWGKINLIKTDINGTALWEKTLINPETYLSPQSICESNTGEIIITGGTGEAGFIVKLDPCGEIVWCTKFENPKYNLVSFNDAVVLDNGDIIALAFTQRVDGNITVQNYLFGFDSGGEFLWKKPFASKNDYPLIQDRILWNLNYFDNYYIMSGEAYYPYPDNPALVFNRPFFVRADSLFNEVFVLPYGVEDSIEGVAFSLKNQEIDGVNTGCGGYNVPNSSERNCLIMEFDSVGNETNFWTIHNGAIGLDIIDNIGYSIISASDSTEIIEATFGSDNTVNPNGELLVNSEYAVLSSFSHPNTRHLTTEIIRTSDSLFLFATSIKEFPDNSKSDILLYKLKADLSQAVYNTNTYIYDSLCDALPIVSDTIYMYNCSIITGLDEIPTPQEYYSFIKTIPVRIFPNPATSGVTFELGNTENHDNIRLSCFDINGDLLFEQPLPPGQTQIKTTLSGWQSGMYIAVASSSTGGAGSEKFVVK